MVKPRLKMTLAAVAIASVPLLALVPVGRIWAQPAPDGAHMSGSPVTTPTTGAPTPTPAPSVAPNTATRSMVMAAAAPLPRKYTRDPAIQVGQVHVEGNKTTLAPGESVRLWIDAPSDFDSWTTSDGQSGTEEDPTLFGKWSNGTMGYSTTWTAPDRQGQYKPTITVNDDLSRGSTNGRNDLLVEVPVTITVVRPAAPKTWDVGDAISPGTASATKQIVNEEQVVTCSVVDAKDSDHWTQGTASGTDDNTLTYQWTSPDGGNFSSPDAASTEWESPILPWDVASADYRLICTINDTAKTLATGETGTRDDDATTITVVVTVTQKRWDKNEEIQGGNLVEPTGANGEPLVKLADNLYIVEQGQVVNLAMEEATDSDYWEYRDTEDFEDDEIKYRWKSLGQGLSSEEGQSVTWTAPLIVGGGNQQNAPAVTYEADDTPKEIVYPEGGERDDDPKSGTLHFLVVRKMWSPIPGITGGVLTGPAANANVSPGERVAYSVSEAHDVDSWTKYGHGGGSAEDGPLTYTWSATEGGFAVQGADGTEHVESEATGLSVVWVAPTNGGFATITCVINDPEGQRVNMPTEGGDHDDNYERRTSTVKVVPSEWKAMDKEIGFHPQRDEQNNIIKPYQWEPDGRLIAPIDQRVANPTSEKVVAPGTEVALEVEGAQDFDTLTTAYDTSIASDASLSYTWTADQGHFKVTNRDGTTSSASSVSGTTATWVAPSGITEGTEANIKCTIDDAADARVTAPETGSHDDQKLERIVTMNVLPWSLKVRRSGTTEFGDSAIVAAGAKDSQEHKADIEVALIDQDGNSVSGFASPSVIIVSGGDGKTDGVATAKVEGPFSTLNENGNTTSTLTFRSGNRSETVQLLLDLNNNKIADTGEPTADIEQKWNSLDGVTDENDAPSAWQYSSDFTVGVSNPITYKMQMEDADGTTVPIKSHQMTFVTTKIKGLEWNPAKPLDEDGDGTAEYYGGYEVKTYGLNDAELAEGGKYANLSTFSKPTQEAVTADSKAATYTSGQIINDYITHEEDGDYVDFFVQSVEFNVIDNDVFE